MGDAEVAVGLETLVLLNPAAGDQEYVPPPDPLSTTPDPLHSETAGPGLAVGRWFTVTAAVARALHPLPSFTVTVYVIDEVGFAVGLETVDELSPVTGVQV
jgi:hypothetical protein